MFGSLDSLAKPSIGFGNLAHPGFFVHFHMEEKLSPAKNAILLDSKQKAQEVYLFLVLQLVIFAYARTSSGLRVASHGAAGNLPGAIRSSLTSLDKSLKGVIIPYYFAIFPG